MRPARIRFAEAIEPANLRQCWSSYPFVDNQLMPVIQAVASNGRAIATLASVSQHTESLGFNPNPTEKTWISADWPNFFREQLESRFGGVAIEMAGPVGSVETPQVFPSPISRIPQQFISASHPAGCRTVFNPAGSTMALGYNLETQALGQQLARAVDDSIRRGRTRARASSGVNAGTSAFRSQTPSSRRQARRVSSPPGPATRTTALSSSPPRPTGRRTEPR